MSKERIEDLGRIYILLKTVFELPIFNEYRMRPKDFPEWFFDQGDEVQIEVLKTFSYGLEELQCKLSEILSVANGDPLDHT